MLTQKLARFGRIALLSAILASTAASILPVSTAAAQSNGVSRPPGWTEETHGSSAEPNYEVVFPDDEVNRLDITISPENWQLMLDDMTELYGEQGTGVSRGGMMPPGGAPGAQIPPGGQRPQGQIPPGGQPPQDGQRPAGQMPQDGMLGIDENPIWVESTIEFEGQVWTHVGIRFKGNSSLRDAWSTGSLKIPLKLDFDEFEDTYPEIEDQRFYGFKQLTLSSNFSDASQLREAVTADIFRDAGVPAAETAFYEVWVDYGEGPVYFGLYTMVEVIDDTVIETQFADDSGNVYKPEGAGATFAAGSFNEASFDKETNAAENDYSDILAVYHALHDATRLTNPAAWRSQLESVFDVDGFLNWLAVNVLVQNWDTYGNMNHNYYLYTDPATGLVTWIPWDNNMALSSTVGQRKSVLSLELTEVDENWPLIRYLIDDPVYHDLYVSYVEAAINGAFEPKAMAARYTELHNLIAPYVAAETTTMPGSTMQDSFEAALDVLINHAYSRYQAGAAYVASQR